MKRIIIAIALALCSASVLADAGQANCARLSDAIDNIANRTLTAPQRLVVHDALVRENGNDPASGESAQVKCGYALSVLHRKVKASVFAAKHAAIPPPDSSEVD